MTTAQAQVPVPEHVAPVVVSLQDRPEQHSDVAEQLWPLLAQVAVWHVPLVVPAVIAHCSPEQQSAEAVQVAPCCWHWAGGWQVPPEQMFEQQSPAAVQAVPFSLQVPASDGS